jgi:predicted Fe-S protein YdhL (DUF1289 family)
VPNTSSLDTPCIGVCRIDTMRFGKYVCGGCLRTLAEIAKWADMTDEERQAVFVLIDARKSIRGS